MEQQSSKNKKFYEEEVTFREILLKIREFFFYWTKNWKWILLISLVVMLLMGGRAMLTPTEYKARLSFMINQDSGNPLGSISGVLGSFGINAKGKNNLSKVLELARSRHIIENSLFKSGEINGQEDLLVNHLITYLDSMGAWNDQAWYRFNSPIKDSLPYRFENRPDTLLMETEKMAIKKLVRKVAGNPETGAVGMMDSHYDEASRILYLSITTENPDLSMQLTNRIFDELSEYYIQTSVEKQLATYEIVKAKSDSIEHLLELKEGQLAALEDTWLGRYSSQSKLKERQLEKEIRLLNITLAESIKNKEIADFAVRNTMPYVQVIDRPQSPLDGAKPSWLKNAFWGLILGGVIGLLFFFFKKLFRDALRH